jgi:phosphoserine aminotransferase
VTKADLLGRPAGRVWNFSAGPATLPDEVILRARDELPNFDDTGMSVMELSHRSGTFKRVAERAESDLRTLLEIPDDYAVLFLQGGATMQFGMVPLNLLAGSGHADYLRTGLWSQKAVAEGQRFCEVHLPVDTKAGGYRALPAAGDWQATPGAAYLHYTSNETINGVQFPYLPDSGGAPLVADMSSDLLSRPVDVTAHGLIYAGAQKNIGPAGLTLVIVRRDLLGRAADGIPSMADYATHAEAGSMYNTPPTLAWYLAGLVFEWLKDRGGVPAMAQVNARKAALLYDFIDRSGLYANPVERHCRSTMNVPFTLADASLDARFLEEAGRAGLHNLGGHRSIGGMRASIYNAMPEAGVAALVEFMQEFERTHG